MDRPIIFSAPMINAIVAGRKIQTRRIIKPRGRDSIFDGGWTDSYVLDPANAEWRARDVRFAVGDRLWVRENFACITVAPIIETINSPMVVYAAADNRTDYGGPWKPSIHMPRTASRLTLIVESVKVERLQDISEEDAEAEGVVDGLHDFDCRNPYFPDAAGYCASGCGSRSYGEVFERLWTSINGPDAWAANPWVCAISFRTIKSNIDALPAEAGTEG